MQPLFSFLISRLIGDRYGLKVEMIVRVTLVVGGNALILLWLLSRGEI